MSKVKARGLRVLLAVAAAVLLVLGFCLWTPVTKTRAADGQIMTANDLMLAIYNVQDGGTVTLGADIALDLNQDGGITGGEPGGHMYIPTRETGAYSFTLDLNGNTITVNTVSGFGCIEVQSGVTVTVKNGTLAGKSNGNFARGAAGSSISLENVTIDFEGLNQEVKPAIATDGALAVSNVTFDLVNAEAIDENTAVTYQTLWDELNLAADGAVVSLKENAVLDKQFKFTEGKKLTLDLGEYMLTIGEGMGNVCALDVRSGSLTIRAGANGAIDGTQADDTTVPVGVMAQGATLTIESGTITTDTKYESCVYAGFGGIAYIKGGKFVNLCEEPFAYDQTSPALAVNVHDNTSGQQMVISGGTFVGRNPVLGDTNVNRTESYMAADAKVAGMADGSFVAFAGEEVPEGAVAVYAQSADEVSAEVYTAEALAAALADGNFETVVLGADITASVSVERTVTLDLNGKTLKNVEGKHTIENYGTLTVIGEGTVDNVSHGRGAVVNYGTAYLNGGLYTRSLENGQSSEDSGGNSWYVLKNYGSMTIDGAKVTQDGHYSSMIANGYQNATDRNTNYGKVTTADKVPTLVIESGEFAGGINTVKSDDYAVMTINGGTFRNVSQAAVLNWNELTITDGVFEVGEAAQAAIITSYVAGGYDNGTTTISGGTFKGAVTVDAGAANVKYSISGGNYSVLPKAEYFAEGFAAVPNAEGGYDAVSEEDYMVTLTVNDTRIAYATLAEAVAAVPADNSEALIEFVGTAQEYSGAGIIVEAGRNIIIDFNNNTYIVTTTVGSSGTETNRFQLKKGSQVVMKDGTIKTSAEISGILIQKYNELTLENMVLDLSDNAQIMYVISNNNGTTTITGNTQIIAAAGKAAFDTYHWPDNGYGAVEVIFDAGFTGKVEGRIEYTTDGTDPEWQSETKLTFADGNTGTYDVDFYIMDGEENANVTVSGGTFKKQVPYELYAEGFVGVWDEEAQAYVTQEGTYVATVDGYGYTTLAEAIAAADGETVKLIANVTENVTIEKSVTIDLNGYSISSASGYAIDVIGGLTQEEKIEVVILSTGEQGTIGSDSNNVGLNVKNFADVTVENVYAKGSIYGIQMGDNGSAYQTVVTMKDSKAEGTGFAGVYVMGTSNAEQPVTLKAENSEFIGQWYGVTGNGTYHNTYIELVNCTVTGTAGDPDSTNYTDMGYGIYHPQDGTLIIDGGTVTGVSAGIEIRSGKLVVKGGAQITGTCKTLYIVENGSGTTVSGAAVAVSQHSTQKPIDVTIEEGTLTGLYALYETDTYATATPSENVEISVTGGTLEGKIHSDNKAGFISGGRFSAQPAEEYFDPDYAAVYRDGWYVTVESTVLRVAQAQAQADVRMYAAALGLSWSDVESNAAQVIELYDAIAETFSEKAVVDAKLAAMDALEAYAEEVKAAEEEATAAQALAQAKAAAQEEVCDYAAMLGTTWTAIANAEGAEAAAAVEKYNAIADAADTQSVADAKLAAKQAVEAYVAAVNAAEEEAAAAWAQAKQDAIAALEQWRDENAEGIVIPTSVYLAVNSAETQDELNTYIDSAKAELSDILTYRGQIAALAEDLGKQMTSLEELSATLTALDEALTGENNYFELQLTDIEEIVAKANAEIKQAVEDAQAAIVSGDADSESLASLKAYLETINNETLGGILTAVNGLGNELAGVDTALSGLSSQLSGLSGALTDVGKTIEESIAATQTKVQSIIDQLGSLATGDDVTAVTGSLTSILEDIAKVQETVDAISVEVNVVTEVTEVKTQAYSDIKAWLDEYLDEIIGTDSGSADVFTLRAYTPETTDGEIYAKLTKAFSEDNAKLVLKYYNEALASIDAAKTVSDVTTAVSTFKAQVASVEAAAQNTPDVKLTAVYVLLAVLLVGVVAAIVILLVRKAPAQAAVAEEAAPAPAEAKAEAEPVEEAKEAPAEEETAVSEAAAEDDDREQVVIAASVRTFSEAYEEMSEEDRDLFNKVREYALAKDDAKEVKQSTGVCVKRNGKQIVKLTIRRGAPVALFFLENEMLKDFRRAASTSAKLKVRATELVLREPADLDTAYMMVDLAVEQIEKDIENAKERRKEARRLRRLQKQAEEEAKAEDDKA